MENVYKNVREYIKKYSRTHPKTKQSKQIAEYMFR